MTYTLMIKPASSLCNLRCRYCFYADETAIRSVSSYGIMTAETTEQMIDQVFGSIQEKSTVTFAFQGGEPTMAGLPYFHHFVAYVKQHQGHHTVNYSLQTNGTLLNPQWCEFLKENRFLVGISLDISPTYHNDTRVTFSGKGSFHVVNQNRRLLEQYKVEYNVLSVLTGSMARHPMQVWKAILDMGVRYVQFIPCLEELQEGVRSPFALTPKRFAYFYNGLFPLWLEEFRKGNYISIRFFDDVLNLLSRGMVTSCGFTGRCSNQTIVEADGSTYPCDFYVLDEFCMGNICRDSLQTLSSSAGVQAFFESKEPLSEVCSQCPYLRICGGGCRRMRDSMYIQGEYCGYRDFLTKNAAALQAVARSLR